MLTFKTQFPIDASKSTEDLLVCARKWIAGSPHSELAAKVSHAKLQDGTSLSSINEVLNCSAFRDSETDIAGVRYEKREDGEIRWVTDVVG